MGCCGVGMEECGGDQTYTDVVNLTEACANAARAGRKGKDLVLEVAGRLADEEDFLFAFPQGKNVPDWRAEGICSMQCILNHPNW